VLTGGSRSLLEATLPEMYTKSDTRMVHQRTCPMRSLPRNRCTPGVPTPVRTSRPGGSSLPFAILVRGGSLDGPRSAAASATSSVRCRRCPARPESYSAPLPGRRLRRVVQPIDSSRTACRHELADRGPARLSSVSNRSSARRWRNWLAEVDHRSAKDIAGARASRW